MELREDQKEILKVAAPWLLNENIEYYNTGQLKEKLGYRNLSSVYRFLNRNGIDIIITPRRQLKVPRLALIKYVLRINDFL